MLLSYPKVLFISSNCFKPVENQFLKWVLDWENRVFEAIWKGRHQYCFDGFICQKMCDSVRNYQIYRKDELGQDRLAWTVFAKALLEENRSHTVKQISHSRRLKRCLYVLIWISFYLQFSNCKLIQIVLKEILLYNQNLRFIFTFLPGMSISLYVSEFLEGKKSKFEYNLCKEFFSMLRDDAKGFDQADVYRWSQPLIYYCVRNSSPLHSHSSADISNYGNAQANINISTLSSIFNKKILPYFRHNLLTLAIQFNDVSLVNILLEYGASAGFKLWDPIKEETFSPETMMISSINSVMASRQFLVTKQNVPLSVLDTVMRTKENICSYAPKLMRSMLHPESKKANNSWNSEKWRTELNKDIADEWGIGCHRPLPSLQHMTKICIRQQILVADCELLPFAINQLPLPYLLKCYVNLDFD